MCCYVKTWSNCSKIWHTSSWWLVLHVVACNICVLHTCTPWCPHVCILLPQFVCVRGDAWVQDGATHDTCIMPTCSWDAPNTTWTKYMRAYKLIGTSSWQIGVMQLGNMHMCGVMQICMGGWLYPVGTHLFIQLFKHVRPSPNSLGYSLPYVLTNFLMWVACMEILWPQVECLWGLKHGAWWCTTCHMCVQL